IVILSNQRHPQYIAVERYRALDIARIDVDVLHADRCYQCIHPAILVSAAVPSSSCNASAISNSSSGRSIPWIVDSGEKEEPPVGGGEAGGDGLGKDRDEGIANPSIY